jgi:hypothetical protein
MRLILLLAIVLAIAGCDNGSRSTFRSPLAPSPPPQAGPPVTAPTPQPTATGVRGWVSDTAFRIIEGATVEVVDGPHAGLSATSDSTGQVSFNGSFDIGTVFRATKEGYLTTTGTVNSSCATCPKWIAFTMGVLATPANIAGDYTLTLIADRTCADLPAEARMRTYTAAITPVESANRPANTYFDVDVSGATLLTGYDKFWIGVAGNYLSISLDWEGPILVEELAANTYVAFGGWATTTLGTAAAMTISTTFDGVIEYCELRSPMSRFYSCNAAAVARAQCTSKNHQIVLTRR